MKPQSDHLIRVVALENLRAMCAHVSGHCHRYEVTKVTRSRVHVTYSNPNEYGRERPIAAVYPCYPAYSLDDGDNPRVVLSMLRVVGGGGKCYTVSDTLGEEWQAFLPLDDCPTLWREPTNGKWESHAAIMRDGRDARVLEFPGDCPSCGKHCDVGVSAAYQIGIMASGHNPFGDI